MSFISLVPHISLDWEQSWCHPLWFTGDTHQAAPCTDARPKQIQGLLLAGSAHSLCFLRKGVKMGLGVGEGSKPSTQEVGDQVIHVDFLGLAGSV